MISLDEAETIALQAFEFVASSPDQLDRMMAVSGLDGSTLVSALQTRDGLAGLLDYLAQDESLLLAFSETAGIAPQRPMQALMVLQKPATTGAA